MKIILPFGFALTLWAGSVEGFSATSMRGRRAFQSRTSLRGMVTLEFIIYPDGRVEEKVVGVKGGDCLKVTEEINEKLGTVITTEPTEEMVEETIRVQEVNVLKNGASESNWSDSSW